MKNIRKLSLHDEIEKEADEIEKEISNDPKLEDISVSEHMERELFKKIADYEKNRSVRSAEEEFSEELSPDFTLRTKEKKNRNLTDVEKEALEIGLKIMEDNSNSGNKKKTRHRKSIRVRVLVACAALLVLVLGVGTTSVGSKSYLKEIIEKITGSGDRAAIINVEDMETKETEDLEEIDAYKEIGKELGISAVRLGYKPPKTALKSYKIDKSQGKAEIYFKCGEAVLWYSIYVNSSNSSLGQIATDSLINSYEIENYGTIINIKEYNVEGENNRYVASFKYHDTEYQLRGSIKRDEFDEIIKNLEFI